MKTVNAVAIFFGMFFLMGCGGNVEQQKVNDIDQEGAQYDAALQEKLSFFKELSVPEAGPVELVNLGQTLFFDKRLSKNETISCNSCHNLETFGVDNLANSPGDDGRNGDRNSPTVLNAALHRSQFWDGRAKNVQEQAGMPILNPIEMGIPDEDYLVKKLGQLEEYKEMFSKAFPETSDPITYENLKTAIAEFEKQLITPSRFDQYLSGNTAALNTQEKKGLMAFTTYNCTQCHSGVLLGGNSLQKFGVHTDYWKLTGSQSVDDGRFKVTNDSLDLYMFKTPSLRNIAKTSPYFHDGSVAELKNAIRIMGKAQLNVDLSEEEVENIEAFLNTLTGEVKMEFQKDPQVQ